MQGFLARIAEAHARGDYGAELDECRKGLVWLPAVVRDNASESWYRGPVQYPLLDRFLELAPAALDNTGLNSAQRIVASVKGLALYVGPVEEARNAQAEILALYDRIRTSPGIVQAELAREAPRVSNVLYIADHLGIVKRVKEGRSYRLEMMVDHSLKRALR